jgi:deoxycytidine triphosphate deaminase
MSLIGLNIVLQRIKEENLIENLGDRDMTNPEGIGIDIRLGSIHKIIEGGAFIEADGKAGQGLRKGVKTEELASYKPNSDLQSDSIIKPGEYYLVQTHEAFNVPMDLMPHVYPRTSLFRAGLLLLVGKPDPGYKGKLTFGLTNLSPFDVKLQMGTRFCNIVFHKIEGETVGYRGQHQGGRVTPEKEERQV